MRGESIEAEGRAGGSLVGLVWGKAFGAIVQRSPISEWPDWTEPSKSEKGIGIHFKHR